MELNFRSLIQSDGFTYAHFTGGASFVKFEATDYQG